MIDTCVLDCDGVLADFLGGALKVLNCKYDENFGPKDIISFDLEKTYGITASEMWSVIEEEPEFWLFLQPLPQAKKIVQFCRDHFKNFVIATSPSMDPHCFRQKYEWLRNLGVRHKEIMIGGAKHLLARSDTVLIDDYEKNIAKFEERGGKVCLYPSYQNSNSHLMGNDFDATQFFLENIFGYSAAEVLGQSLDLIVPEKLRERHWQGYREVMATGVAKYGSELLAVPAVRSDGSRVSIEFTIGLVHTSSGELLGTGAVIRDVTQRWQKEKDLQKRLAALEEQKASR